MRKFLNMRTLLFVFSFFALALGSCSNNGTNSKPNVNGGNNTNSARVQEKAPVYSYEVVNTFPHDPKAFTEGLFFYNGYLYESTGEEKESSLRRVDLKTGKADQKFDLAPELFGEGIAEFKDKIYQLTWRNHSAFVYDLKTFKMLQEFEYPDDGWGMTHDDKNLIVSNGTHVLKFLNPETLKTEKTLPVFREDGKPQMNLNELEYIKGEIWANIWHSELPDILGKPNRIVRIDPGSGKILGWIDLSNISPDDVKRDSENTLNGIAYDAQNERIFVTGKNWKKLFEIKVIPPPQPPQ